MDASASTPGARSEVREAADERANRLYWGSDLSVSQIATTLDLSKGALYEIIRPLPAALACPLCEAETVHPNRTARERRLIVCLSCRWEGDDGQAVPARANVEPRAPSRPPAVPSEAARVRPGLAVPLVIGAAVGMGVLLWALRRK